MGRAEKAIRNIPMLKIAAAHMLSTGAPVSMHVQNSTHAHASIRKRNDTTKLDKVLCAEEYSAHAKAADIHIAAKTHHSEDFANVEK